MTKHRLKQNIIRNKLLDYFCFICKISAWNNKYISLHLDHIDGNNCNNDIQNLRFLCPNCHSQTDTYAGKNNKKRFSSKNKKVTDEQLLEAMFKTECPAHAFDLLGLARSNNYYRIYRLAKKHNIVKHMSRNDYVHYKSNLLDKSNLNKKRGWVNEAAKILEMTPQAAGRWIRNNYPSFLTS